MSFLSWVVAALVILLPLALAPGWFFYYDITPKACLLFIGAAAALAGVIAYPQKVLANWNSRTGRWFVGLLLALLTVMIAAALMSSYPRLAWMGSNWRRAGVLTEAA